jgi:hypothetical protein|nr:MAG TPA: upper collar protein [Caudoviricetes sp.]
MARNYDKYTYGILPCNEYKFTDKNKCIDQHIAYMLNRTLSMFDYDGLPITIDKRNLELMLQTNGNVCWYKYNDNLYVFTGGLGGEPNVYYMPTIYTIANPALKISKELVIDKDCVVMPNDFLYLGLLPLNKRYATSLTENELSMNIASINARITSLISASDDNTKKSAEKYIEDITKGKLGVIAENAFFDGIKSQPYGTTASNAILTSLIEQEQYLKASWYNDLGLNANYNMKRESINSQEGQLNDDMLMPLIDSMLYCRQKALEKVNQMFGTSITVKKASSWEDNQIEIDKAQNDITLKGGVDDGIDDPE